jgi:hypothetical protein
MPVCRIKTTRLDNGNFDVKVERTLPKEGKTRLARDVPREDLEQVTERLVKEIRGET